MFKQSEVVYYAKFDGGIIIEGGDFREVYQAVRVELRTEHGHSLFYDYGSVTIFEGVRVDWSEDGHNYFKHIPIRPVVTLSCSSIDRVTKFVIRKDD